MVFYLACIRGTLFGILLLYSIYTEDIIWYSTRCMYKTVFDRYAISYGVFNKVNLGYKESIL